MREIGNISSSLFDKIRSRFDNVRLGDKNAKSTQDPEKARFINFDYETSDGHKIGNITISLVDETGLKVYFSKDISNKLEDGEKDEWFKFLRNLRQFAKRNLLTFDTRDIARSNLQIKDIKQQSKSDSTLNTADINVTESRLWGTSRSSYQEVGPVRIIVRHSKNIDEEKRGSRGRNIEAVFVETEQGERRLLPFKNLHGARAMATHCSHGGAVDDEISESIIGMCQEMADMAHFVRTVRKREFEDRETAEMAKSALHRYGELKNKLHGLSTRRGYKEFVECYMPETAIEDEMDVDALRERFVRKIYDERLDQALPYVYRAYKREQSKQQNEYTKRFESWADKVTEGTWDQLEDESSRQQLDKLMAQPIEVGIKGDNASGLLYDIIGDDSLFDSFYEKSEAEGSDADARPIVIKWLRDNGFAELADKYDQKYTQDQEPLQAQAQAMQQQQVQQNAGQNAPTGGTGIPTDQPMAEESDPLDFLRSLAGLRR